MKIRFIYNQVISIPPKTPGTAWRPIGLLCYKYTLRRSRPEVYGVNAVFTLRKGCIPSPFLLNTLHHGLPIQAAVAAPRLFRGLREDIYVSTDMPETAVFGLPAMGYPVVPQDPEKFPSGRVTGIMIDSGGRPGLQGVIEKYSDGKAVGY